MTLRVRTTTFMALSSESEVLPGAEHEHPYQPSNNQRKHGTHLISFPCTSFTHRSTLATLPEPCPVRPFACIQPKTTTPHSCSPKVSPHTVPRASLVSARHCSSNRIKQRAFCSHQLAACSLACLRSSNSTTLLYMLQVM